VQHVRVGVLVDEDAGRGVGDVDVADAALDPAPPDDALHLPCDVQGVRSLA
jgi:hypothetical protein